MRKSHASQYANFGWLQKQTVNIHTYSVGFNSILTAYYYKESSRKTFAIF